MQAYEYELIGNSINILGSFLTIGFIGFLNLIFTICAMFVISQDAQKRKIKCWHWNLILFLISPTYLSFIVVIFYIVFACGNNPIIENDVIIDARSNDNSNNKNTNYINANLPKTKTKSYPKYLLFYGIIQLVSLCISFGILTDVVDEVFDILKLNIHYVEPSISIDSTIIEPDTKSKHNYVKPDKDNYIKPDKNHSNSNNFGFQNIKISDDIEDYAMQVFSAYTSSANKFITSVDNSNSTTFYTFDTFLSSPSGNDIVQFFFDNLVTYEFMYNNGNQGFLQISPNLSNLTFEEINSLELKSMSNFYSEDLKSILLISQNINGFTLNKVVGIDIDDLETVDLNKYAIQKGYPVYVSVYSNILSDNYYFNITLS